MNRAPEEHEHARTADALRDTLARLLGADGPYSLILAPGVALSLQLVLQQLRIRGIVFSPSEYLDARHFPGLDARIAHSWTTMSLRKQAARRAVLASVVSWKGEDLRVAEVYRSLRMKRGFQPSLLIADYSHAGAIGFPGLESLHADIVCGEIGKWLLPPALESSITFVWFRTRSLWERCRPAFCGFYLAIPGRQQTCMARWINPHDIRAVSGALKQQRLTRARLIARHRRNRTLANEVAKVADAASNPKTAVVLTRFGQRNALLKRLRTRGLSWILPDGTERFLCRADVVDR